MDKQELFRYYITDPERIKREKGYFIQYLIAGALYIASIFYIYANFPTGTIAQIPIFCWFAWSVIWIHYFYFTVYKGAEMLKLKDERERGLG